MFKFVKSLFSFKKTYQPNRFRPSVELLEDRNCPTQIAFVLVAGFAGNPSNWYYNGSMEPLERLPNSGDTLHIYGELSMDINLEVAGLVMGQDGKIIVGNHTLQIGNAVSRPADALFQMYENAEIIMNHQNSLVYVFNHPYAGVTDSAGFVDGAEGQGGLGRLVLGHGTVLNVSSGYYEIHKFHTQIQIGLDDPQAEPSYLSLYGNASLDFGDGRIDILRSGAFRLQQNEVAVVFGSSMEPIHNKGLFAYAADDLVTVHTALWNEASTSRFMVLAPPESRNSALVIDDHTECPDVLQLAGTTTVKAGTPTDFDYEQAGGELRLNGTEDDGTIDTHGYFDIKSGDIYFGYNGQSILPEIVTWNNTGDIDLHSTVTVWMKTAVSEGATGHDRIYTTGNIDLSSATLRVQERFPPELGWVFDLVVAEGHIVNTFGEMKYGWNGDVSINGGGGTGYYTWEYVEDGVGNVDYFALVVGTGQRPI